jgi:hypothetical protein
MEKSNTDMAKEVIAQEFFYRLRELILQDRRAALFIGEANLSSLEKREIDAISLIDIMRKQARF